MAFAHVATVNIDRSIVRSTSIADGHVLIPQLTLTARIDAGTFEQCIALKVPDLATSTDERAVLSPRVIG
jgi:hypothetical protein